MATIAGIGIGLRARHLDELCQRSTLGADFLEITPENWLFDHGPRRTKLDALIERAPVISHSVSLSVGGLDPFDQTLTDVLKQFLRKTRAPFFSDHLCWSSHHGRPLHELLPLPFNDEVVKHTAARIKQLQQRMETPFAMENATYYAHMPGSVLDEADFINAVLDESGCKLLLDVNNVYVNAKNHGFDPQAFIDRMPMDRVVQLHVAGHTPEDGVIIDTHIGPICDDVWALYRYTQRRASRHIPTLVEWDAEIPPLDELLGEVARAR